MLAKHTITEGFDEWWHRFKRLAAECGLPIGAPHEYREYFADGDSPENTFAEELRRLDDATWEDLAQ